ncbi:MAG: hypothetical protein K9G46_04245 [Flavobacteriales bacterium]|jgi:hypothetical protein|nr:hypothetical protein [Flavobacteriales bacterium]
MKNSELNLLGLNALKFIAVLLVVDFGLGTIAERLYFSQTTGKQARIIASLNFNDSELLVLGSSHANRHYVPEVFENLLGFKSYNAGVQGQRLLFTSTLQKMILDRSKPKIIIVNIDNNWMQESQEAYDRLSDFHPFYWEYRKILLPVLNLKSTFVDLRMSSKAYRMNSTLVHMAFYFVKPQEAHNGYLPSYKKMALSTEVDSDGLSSNTEKPAIDTNFVTAFDEIIETSSFNEVKLVFVVSPTFHVPDKTESESMQIMVDRIKEKNLPFYDFRGDSAFMGKPNLFFDPAHLNHEGAVLFSGLVAAELEHLGLSAKAQAGAE